jgi:hypothetical protein
VLAAAGTTTLVGATASLLGASLAVEAHPLPNTILVNTLGIKVVLNEQIVSGDGVTGLSITVNAIHVYLTNVNVAGVGILNGDIIVAQSKAERNCVPECQ